MYRLQKNVTLTEEQQKFILDNYKEMTYSQIGEAIGVHMRKVISNMRVMGIKKSELIEPPSFERNGYFDVDRFSQHYNY